jgi:hypothetical protein
MNNNRNMRNTIKIMIGAGLIALTSTTLLCCSEIEDGVNTIDSWPEVKSYVPENGLPHPCLLHSNEDFEYIKAQLDKGKQPWTNAFEHLTRVGNPYSQKGYNPSPVKKLARLDATNWAAKDRWIKEGIEADWYEGVHSNYMNFSRDCAAAYAQAVLWKITGEEEYAKTSVNILNKWAGTCVGYITNKSGEFIDPNEQLIALVVYQFANAAELMRDYGGWSSDDFIKFKNWMIDVFYTRNSAFLSSHNSAKCPLHEWFNWDLANMTSMLSIAILADDNFKINEAIQYFKMGSGSGMIYNGIPFTHQDPDSQEILGQCQESGRDQGHSTLCVAMLSIFCKMAASVGEDLFAYDNYRPLSMFEYYAKYNVGTREEKSEDGKSWLMKNFKYDVSSVPFTTLEKCTSSEASKQWTSLSFEEHQNGKDTRGSINAAWELVCRMAEDHGQSAIYSTMFRDVMRQNASRGYCDGGAGDYGPDSGGFDVFGWGSLLYAKDKEDVQE